MKVSVPLVCSSQGIDTSGNNPCGKFQLDVLKAVCEFERNLIRDRVNSGLAAARARGGVRLGRPNTLHKRAEEVLALKETAWASARSAASWGWSRRRCIQYWLEGNPSGNQRDGEPGRLGGAGPAPGSQHGTRPRRQRQRHVGPVNADADGRACRRRCGAASTQAVNVNGPYVWRRWRWR